MTAPAIQADFLRLFVEGFAQYLAGAGIGLSWQADGKYASGQTGVYIASVPSAPNRVVTLTPYPLASDPTLSNGTVGLQIRSRSAAADLRDALSLDGSITNVLDGNFPLDLPTGVHVSTVQWTSGGSLGYDTATKTWSWSSNYTTKVYRPGAHRL